MQSPCHGIWYIIEFQWILVPSFCTQEAKERRSLDEANGWTQINREKCPKAEISEESEGERKISWLWQLVRHRGKDTHCSCCFCDCCRCCCCRCFPDQAFTEWSYEQEVNLPCRWDVQEKTRRDQLEREAFAKEYIDLLMSLNLKWISRVISWNMMGYFKTMNKVAPHSVFRPFTVSLLPWNQPQSCLSDMATENRQGADVRWASSSAAWDRPVAGWPPSSRHLGSVTSLVSREQCRSLSTFSGYNIPAFVAPGVFLSMSQAA